MVNIGLIGLGVIGQIYAANLIRAFGPIYVFDSERKRTEAAVNLGAVSSENGAELASSSEMIILALPSPEAVRSAVCGEDGILTGARPGTIIVDLSTIDPKTAVDMHERAKAAGVDYLDSPISGGQPGGAGTDGARAANVTFMVSGDEGAFERARPVMEALGEKFFFLGEAGTGTKVKLLSNFVSGMVNLISAEAFALGAAAGVDAKTLMDVFDETDADCYFMQNYVRPRIERGDFEPGFSIDLQYKDLRLMSEWAREDGIPVPINELGVQLYQMARAAGLGGKDLVESVNYWAGVAGTPPACQEFYG